MRLPALALLLASAACAAAGDDATTTGDAPLIGVDGSADTADRACHVVLRDLARPSNGTGGWQTSGSSWVWTGTIDVSTEAALEGHDPRVLYHYGSNPTWWQAAAVPSDAPAPAGMTRYTVTLDHDLPGPGMSGSALATATVEVVPFLALVEGGRLFDHNRHPGDFDNYILNLGNAFSVGAAPSVCPGFDAPPPARLVFAADWTESAIGALAGGGRVRIEYDLARLAACRNTTHGHPLWDVIAHTRWEPSGAVESHSVRDGQPTLAIPPGTTAAVLWFENTQIGGGCHAWDSDYGANYTFAVTP